jgi:hypothetical protein
VSVILKPFSPSMPRRMANDYRFAAVSLTPDAWADKMAGSNAELFPEKKGHRIRDAGVPSHRAHRRRRKCGEPAFSRAPQEGVKRRERNHLWTMGLDTRSASVGEVSVF